jgi:hypothetical protein
MTVGKSRLWVAGASLLVGLLVGVGFWFQTGRLRQEERHDVWLAYLRGPLALYVRGSRQGAPLLELRRSDPARREGLADAVRALHDSAGQASAQQPDFEADAFFEDLDEAVQWHGAAARAAEQWPGSGRGDGAGVPAARRAAEGFHAKLASLVGDQWQRAGDELTWSRSEQEESQAAVDALLAPLPR